ncbi:hypothetical protein [Paenibacillus apiarius]|uniref:hypothetical protein n=1 Tax=Paenibacillus apiarius TaxID=46240 RepID=UPI003B3B7975
MVAAQLRMKRQEIQIAGNGDSVYILFTDLVAMKLTCREMAHGTNKEQKRGMAYDYRQLASGYGYGTYGRGILSGSNAKQTGRQALVAMEGCAAR